jgi:hypothetical protein
MRHDSAGSAPRLKSLRLAADQAPGASYETWAISSLLLAALALSWFASSGPIQWMDNGWLVFKASQGLYFNDRLEATYHPLYMVVSTVLFKLFGANGVGYLNSGLMVPIAYVAYRLSRTLGLDQRYAAMAALAVVLLQNVFWVSTKVEVYALHLLIVLTAYWIVFDEGLQWRPSFKIFVVGVLTGLGAATHQLTFIVLAPLYLFLWQRNDWTGLSMAFPGFVLGGFSCYPPMLNDVLSGTPVVTVLRLFMTGSDGATPEGWEGSLLRFDRMWADKSYVMLVLVSLCGIGIVGLLQQSTMPKPRTLWWAAILNLLFSVSFDTNDRFTFFLPGAAFFAILGVAFVYQRYAGYRVAYVTTLALILAHPLVLTGTALLAGRGMIQLPAHSATLAYRDDIRYFLSPYIPDRSAAEFAMAYEQSVPRGSVVLADFSPFSALLSAQITGHFLDRTLINCEEKRSAWPDTMYLVRKGYCERFITGYKAEPAAVGWIISKDSGRGTVQQVADDHHRPAGY